MDINSTKVRVFYVDMGYDAAQVDCHIYVCFSKISRSKNKNIRLNGTNK